MKSVPFESAWSNTSYSEITVLLLEQQGKSLFCMGSTDHVSRFFFFFLFFFSRPNGLPENHKEMLNGSFKSYFAYLRAFYKFCRLQVPYGTKMVVFWHFSRGGTSRLPEHRRPIFHSSYKIYCSYLRSSYKFHHLQVPNSTKNGAFGVVSLVEKLGLLGKLNL